MNLIHEILKEHSKNQTIKIVEYVGADAKRFQSLVKIFLKGPYRVTQRAAWPLSYCVEHHPTLIIPHLNAILKNLSRKDTHDAVKRNTLRLLQFIDIPKKYHGKVTDMCFSFLTGKQEPIAVKVFAMTVLANIAIKIPALKSELIIVIEDQLPYSTGAYISRAKKVLKQLKKGALLTSG